MNLLEEYIMEKYNFTHILDLSENSMVNKKYNKKKSLLDRGLITKSEAIYSFQKWAMDNFINHEAFEICTNIEF